MKKKINGIIVVEGKSDVELLSSYIDAEFVITNGSAISDETITYLKNSNRDIYVLTDPDFPGKKIRDELSSNIANLKHVFIKKENSIKHGKVGVAEGDINEILEAIENAYEEKEIRLGNLTMSDLNEMGLTGSEDSRAKRDLICDKLHLGFCNAKTLLKRLNNNGITKEELRKYVG